MAKMFPNSLSLLNPTLSEQKVFEALKSQLPDDVSIFYSVSWNEGENGIKTASSEVDFLIVDPRFGYLCVEVKGGKGIEIIDGEWYLNEGNDHRRKLNKSPYEQVEKSMFYFRNYYQKQYNFPFQGIYGSIVIFPMFNVDRKEFISNRSKELTLDYSDMHNLEAKIIAAFNFWSSNKSFNKLTKSQHDNFIALVKKRIAMSAAAGALIEERERQFETLNRVQDNYIYFIENYTRVYITGGAGTGKTFIGLKLIKKFENKGKTLFICYSKRLKHFIKDQSSSNNLDVISLQDDIINTQKKYDFIIVDEAQDFDYHDSKVIVSLLKNENSHIYVFFDKSQNILNKDFKDGFGINLPAFVLKENLRNTSSIYKYAVQNTDLGQDVIVNKIDGPQPEILHFKSSNLKDQLEDLVNYLVFEEYVFHKDICILVEEDIYKNLEKSVFFKWILKSTLNPNENEIKIFTVSEYKGLESNVVIYIRKENVIPVEMYIAYTRARFYLYEIIVD